MLEFGFRPAQHTKPVTLLDAAHCKDPETRKVSSQEVLLMDEAFALNVAGAANERDK